MLKIKNNVDFKELLKHGFKRINYLPIYHKIVYYDKEKLYNYIEYDINTKTRYLSIKTVNIGCHIDFVLDNTVFNLFNDNLLEVSGDNNE